jgi:hypothetical protein
MQGVEITPTPQLNVRDLYTARHTRDAARLKAYNKLLDIVHHRIRTISQLPNSPCSLLYTIPPFILGLPKIDLEDCVTYLVYQLRETGFQVRYTYPNLLNISWLHHEKSYILEQSPIMQAMIEAHEKKRLEDERKAMFAKKLGGRLGTRGGASASAIGSVSRTSGAIGTTTSFMQPKRTGDFRSPPVRDLSAPSVGHIPSASDYTPPSAFMKQMTEPPKVTFADPPASSANPLADLWK